jgi:Zierdtviridae exonuclease
MAARMKFNSNVDLPVITSTERADFKRCPKRWYWKWRLGLVPRKKTFGALDFGQWKHTALANWYLSGTKRRAGLANLFERAATEAIDSSGVTDPDELQKSDEMVSLGIEMAGAYQREYGMDPDINILAVELPLEFTFSNSEGLVLAVHKLKPDAVFSDQNNDVWLLEHKTAKQIMTEHLPLDGQARPYGAMAEIALRKAGLIKPSQAFRGILYNFLRKALPDQRERNSAGQYLNKDGSVSKRQPPPYFVRKPVTMTRLEKRITLNRLREEGEVITLRTLEILTGELKPFNIPKTDHKSCAKTCPFFNMCVAEEQGIDIRDMMKLLYRKEDPYAYHKESTEDVAGFEIG